MKLLSILCALLDGRQPATALHWLPRKIAESKQIFFAAEQIFSYVYRVSSGRADFFICESRSSGVGFEFVLGRPECIHIIKDGNSS